MQRKEFIQTACVAFMPHLEWSLDKSINYAEKLWERLGQRGYGESKAYATKDKPLVLNAYDSLDGRKKAYFDRFWSAYNHKEGKQKTAEIWDALGDLSNDRYDFIIARAGMAAKKHKAMPEGMTPLYPERWLAQSKFDDELTVTEVKQKETNQQGQKLAKLAGDIAHAKRMADMTGEQFWQDEANKLTEKLTQLRNENATTR
jgi:hypothetical protein